MTSTYVFLLINVCNHIIHLHGIMNLGYRSFGNNPYHVAKRQDLPHMYIWKPIKSAFPLSKRVLPAPAHHRYGSFAPMYNYMLSVMPQPAQNYERNNEKIKSTNIGSRSYPQYYNTYSRPMWFNPTTNRSPFLTHLPIDSGWYQNQNNVVPYFRKVSPPPPVHKLTDVQNLSVSTDAKQNNVNNSQYSPVHILCDLQSKEMSLISNNVLYYYCQPNGMDNNINELSTKPTVPTINKPISSNQLDLKTNNDNSLNKIIASLTAEPSSLSNDHFHIPLTDSEGEENRKFSHFPLISINTLMPNSMKNQDLQSKTIVPTAEVYTDKQNEEIAFIPIMSPYVGNNLYSTSTKRSPRLTLYNEVTTAYPSEPFNIVKKEIFHEFTTPALPLNHYKQHSFFTLEDAVTSISTSTSKEFNDPYLAYKHALNQRQQLIVPSSPSILKPTLTYKPLDNNDEKINSTNTLLDEMINFHPLEIENFKAPVYATESIQNVSKVDIVTESVSTARTLFTESDSPSTKAVETTTWKPLNILQGTTTATSPTLKYKTTHKPTLPLRLRQTLSRKRIKQHGFNKTHTTASTPIGNNDLYTRKPSKYIKKLKQVKYFFSQKEENTTSDTKSTAAAAATTTTTTTTEEPSKTTETITQRKHNQRGSIKANTKIDNNRDKHKRHSNVTAKQNNQNEKKRTRNKARKVNRTSTKTPKTTATTFVINAPTSLVKTSSETRISERKTKYFENRNATPPITAKTTSRNKLKRYLSNVDDVQEIPLLPIETYFKESQQNFLL